MPKSMKNTLSILFLVLAPFAQIASANGALDAETVAKIEAVFADTANRAGPGYAAGIVEDGKVLYAAGYGSANLDDGIAITPQTDFHLASLSKQFTGSAIALLVLDGKVRLDDPVEKYIPGAQRY